MRLACVGDNGWCELVNLAAPDHEHVRVEHVSPRDAMPFAAFNPARSIMDQVIESALIHGTLSKRAAQAVCPHYFEKQRTDGVDYSIYAGASLLE